MKTFERFNIFISIFLCVCFLFLIILFYFISFWAGGRAGAGEWVCLSGWASGWDTYAQAEPKTFGRAWALGPRLGPGRARLYRALGWYWASRLTWINNIWRFVDPKLLVGVVDMSALETISDGLANLLDHCC